MKFFVRQQIILSEHTSILNIRHMQLRLMNVTGQNVSNSFLLIKKKQKTDSIGPDTTREITMSRI